jgi:chromosome segregation ATPase
MYLSSNEILHQHYFSLSRSFQQALETSKHFNFIQSQVSRVTETEKITQSEIDSLESLYFEKKLKLQLKKNDLDSRSNQVLMEIEDQISFNGRINENNELKALQESHQNKLEIFEDLQKNFSKLAEQNKNLEQLKNSQEATIRDLIQEKDDNQMYSLCLVEEKKELGEKIKELEEIIKVKKECEAQVDSRNEFLLKEMNESLNSVEKIEKENEELRMSLFEDGDRHECKDLIICGICSEPEMGRMKSCIKCSVQVHARCTKDLRYVCLKCKN